MAQLPWFVFMLVTVSKPDIHWKVQEFRDVITVTLGSVTINRATVYKWFLVVTVL
jgi:hypothetical protein